jgi:flagellar basal-body rod protein FlgC
MISSLDISTSALVAQQARITAIAGNLANMSSQRNENGELQPYQARHVIFQTDTSVGGGDPHAAGVKVASVETESVEPNYKYEPTNPLRIKSGRWKDHVAYPNVDMTREMVNALEATRSYEANVGVIEITKSMAGQTLRILA